MFFNKILQLSKMFGYKRILHTVENKAEKLVWWQNMVLPLSSALMMRDCDEFVMVWTEYLSEKWLWNWLASLSPWLQIQVTQFPGGKLHFPEYKCYKFHPRSDRSLWFSLAHITSRDGCSRPNSSLRKDLYEFLS